MVKSTDFDIKESHVQILLLPLPCSVTVGKLLDLLNLNLFLHIRGMILELL